jgi:HSP20 family molecular chaperone IbpA
MRTGITVGDFFGSVYSVGYPTIADGAWNSGYTITSYPWDKGKVFDRNPVNHDDVITRLEQLIQKTGTPWDNVNGFPPFNVDLHSETGAVRFQFALSGVDPDTVQIQFSDNKIWLVIDKQEDEESVWKPIKHKIKGSVSGKYYYEMDLEKFDYEKSEAKWKEGILEVVVPLREDQRPYTLKVSR